MGASLTFDQLLQLVCRRGLLDVAAAEDVAAKQSAQRYRLEKEAGVVLNRRGGSEISPAELLASFRLPAKDGGVVTEERVMQVIAEESGRTNFEQLVQLGNRGNVDANDQHIVHIVDWLLAVRLRAARERHPHRAARDAGNVRFRIDGVLHQVYQIPMPVHGRDDQPHQDPRPHGRRREAPPAGRPHQDAHARRPGDRAAPVDHADGLRREAGDAHLRSRTCSFSDFASSASPTTTRPAGTR
jgi:hypothetical protein